MRRTQAHRDAVHTRGGFVGVVVLVLAAALASCSSGSKKNGSSASSSTASSAPCAWPTRADKATLNIAYPDTASTYWSTSYRLAAGEHLELQGTFPRARYFSFITYGVAGGAISVLNDREIQPDAGDANPYRGQSRTGGRYTVVITAHAGTTANALSAASPATNPSAASTTTMVPTPGTVAPLGTGAAGAEGVVGGTVIYRVYLPQSPSDPAGGTPLPTVVDVRADGSRVAVPTCAHAGANPAATIIVNQNGPATNTPAPAEPTFVRPKQNATNLYPDPDNIYLATIVHYTPGRVVVVRGKAPTFPNTSAGQPVVGTEQVRYWSLCTNEYRKPYPVSFCVPDEDVALDARGYYTFVISTPADRPANATTANAITWLDWGSTTVDNLLLMRQMLPRSTDPQSAANVEPGALASSAMGPYAPRGAYCTTATFAQRGLSGCGMS